MDAILHEEKTFEGLNYSERKLPKTEFIDCTFINCNFSRADLTDSDFIDCHCRGCNFSLATVENTGFKNMHFKDCKLTGIDFSKCSDFLFSLELENCPLDYCSFAGKKMKKTLFTDCPIKNADFTETDLSQAVFKKCDLQDSSFVRCILEKADFRGAVNYSFDPDQNKMKKARFSMPAVIGLLAKYQLDIE
jgi:fluoroquinolone resistance protein